MLAQVGVKATATRSARRESSYFWGSGKVAVDEENRDQDGGCDIEFTADAQGPPESAHGGSSAAAHCALLAKPCAETVGLPEMALAATLIKVTYLKLTPLVQTHVFKVLECKATDREEIFGRGRIANVSGDTLTESEVCFTNVLNMRLVKTLRTDSVALAETPLFATIIGQIMSRVRTGDFPLRGPPLIPENLLGDPPKDLLVPGLKVYVRGPRPERPKFRSYDFGPNNNMSLWSTCSPELKAMSSLLAARGATSQADSLINDKAYLSPGALFVALDHIMGHNTTLGGTPCVTAFLKLEILQGVELDPEACSFVYMHSYIEKEEGRKVFVRASAHAVTLEAARSRNRDDWAKMPQVATAHALFIRMTFPSHPQPTLPTKKTESKL